MMKTAKTFSQEVSELPPLSLAVVKRNRNRDSECVRF
jgi:hypothetical protein